MCVRFFIDRESKELAPLIAAAGISPLADRFRNATKSSVLTGGEFGPLSVAPVIATSRSGNRSVFPMQWGFRVQRTDLNAGKEKVYTNLFNARSETAKDKAAFRDAWANHRCIVPASWYFEWEHGVDSSGKSVAGKRWSIQPRGETVTWLCSLYRYEEGLPHFVVLTREAPRELRRIHDRMPLILPVEGISRWIDPNCDPSELLKSSLTDMVCWE